MTLHNQRAGLDKLKVPEPTKAKMKISNKIPKYTLVGYLVLSFPLQVAEAIQNFNQGHTFWGGFTLLAAPALLIWAWDVYKSKIGEDQ